MFAEEAFGEREERLASFPDKPLAPTLGGSERFAFLILFLL